MYFTDKNRIKYFKTLIETPIPERKKAREAFYLDLFLQTHEGTIWKGSSKLLDLPKQERPDFLFLDENGKTNLSIFDVGGSVLSVSQFTLYANLKKGNRPSYVEALKGEESILLYQMFNSELKKCNLDVKEGVFGADMKVELVNDGPYTLVLDSKELGF